MELGVVIPTLNESLTLPTAIGHVRATSCGSCPIAVADCGSGDGTPALACAAGAICVSGCTSRADAMNRGAAAMPASVDTLLFLHADTRLPSGFKDTIACALRRPEVVGGAFDFSFGDHPQMSGMRRWMLQAITHVNRFRFRWGRSFYGDQAIFVSRRIFEHIGGYPKVRLMEDIAFSRRMHRIGRTAILQPPVQTSPRRFIERGIAWQFCCDLLLLVLDSLGIRPAPLSRHYNSLNAVGHRNPTFEAAGEFRH